MIRLKLVVRNIYDVMCLNELPSANVSGSVVNVRLEQCECV